MRQHRCRFESGGTASRLDEKIDRTAAETQALVQVSYTALDRRIRTLEER